MMKRKGKLNLSRAVEGLKTTDRIVRSLRSIRQKWRIPLADVARACRVSLESVRQWESGGFSPKLPSLILLTLFLAQRQEIIKTARIYSENELRRQRERERRGEVDWSTGNFYSERPEELARVKRDRPEFYRKLIPFLPQACRR